ncbi:MAG: helix-turn-helix domain-containing protein [Prosthecobacter sp.]|uniref:helix-turn-helix domain-containing protein n=1 Tax=Prosthecobacter sp. TaxID=1965333 RepID=UPI0039035478
MKPAEIRAIHTEIAALRSGKVAPSRAWKLERLPDGSVRRTALKPEVVCRANAESEAKRLAQDARAALKVTQKDFAALLGVSVRTLHQWEQGRRKPTGAALTLLRVALANPRAVMHAAHA